MRLPMKDIAARYGDIAYLTVLALTGGAAFLAIVYPVFLALMWFGGAA